MKAMGPRPAGLWLLTIIVALTTPGALFAQQVRIETPRGGVVNSRVVTIAGRVTGFNKDRARIIINGIPQGLALSGERFELQSAVAPGTNMVEVIAGGARDRVSFFSRVPAKDIKVVLTWDTPTDVDLWVTDPTGERCYYAHRASKSRGNLDVDITAGYGPETFTMAAGLPGEYSIQVQYYGSRGAPITKAPPSMSREWP